MLVVFCGTIYINCQFQYIHKHVPERTDYQFQCTYILLYLRAHDVEEAIKQPLLDGLVVDRKEPSPQLDVGAPQARQECRLQLSRQLSLTQRVTPIVGEGTLDNRMLRCTRISAKILGSC